MPCLRIFLGLFLALTVAVGAAGASPAIQPDLLTVSGRQALPRADGTNLEGRLRVVDITIDPNSPRETIGWPSDLQLTLAQAINKSFLNFGYRAESPSNNSISLSLEVAPVDLHVDATGALAEATLRFHQTPGDPHDACFPYDAKGRFRALAREQSGDGQRVLGVAAAVGLALVGVNGGVLLSTEFQTAGSDNSARNVT